MPPTNHRGLFLIKITHFHKNEIFPLLWILLGNNLNVTKRADFIYIILI